MNNTISRIASDEKTIARIKCAYDQMPQTDIRSLLAGIAAKLYVDRKMFLSNPESVNELARKLCEEESKHGIAVFDAYKLSDVFAGMLYLDTISQILFGIYSYEYNDEESDFHELDAYADKLEKVIGAELPDISGESIERVFGGESEYIVACALLCLAGRETEDMYNYAYDKLIPALEDITRFTSDNIPRDVATALEILKYAPLAFEDSDYFWQIEEDPLKYVMLLISALAECSNKEGHYHFFCGLDTVDDSECEDEEYAFEYDGETDELDRQLDALNWDEFFVNEE